MKLYRVEYYEQTTLRKMSYLTVGEDSDTKKDICNRETKNRLSRVKLFSKPSVTRIDSIDGHRIQLVG